MIDHYQQSIFDGTEQSMYNQSIELIKTFEEVALQRNPVGYVVGYSGGKDSDVLVDLFRKSGVKFMVIHNHTTLDAPESVRRSLNRASIEMRDKENYKDIQLFHFDKSEEVRQTDTCYTKNYFIVNPLAYWNDNYLWNYIHSERLEINPLYSQGFDRVGCVGCPMAGLHRLFEFERYPKYKARFIKLCDDIMELRKRENLSNKYGFKNGTEYFNYWLYEELPKGESLFDMEAQR